MRDGTDGNLDVYFNLRQFSGELGTKRGMAATDEVPAGIGGGGRWDERIYFLGLFGGQDRGF